MSSNDHTRADAPAGPGPVSRRGRRGWTRTRAVMSLGMVLGLGAVGTMAAWTDQATATTGVFSVSEMQMMVDGQTGDHQFLALKKQFQVPDQTFAAEITVANTGTQDFTWKVSPTVTDDPSYAGLASNLWVEVFDGDVIGDSSCSGNEITGARTLAAEADETVCIQIGLTDYGAADRFKIGTLGLDFVAEGQ